MLDVAQGGLEHVEENSAGGMQVLGGEMYRN
jgi:hypothetical protein